MTDWYSNNIWSLVFDKGLRLDVLVENINYLWVKSCRISKSFMAGPNNKSFKTNSKKTRISYKF